MQEKNTSNAEREKLTDFLKDFANAEPLLLVTLTIYPRIGETGMLEERGSWIEQILEKLPRSLDNIEGFRILWTQLFFVIFSENESTVLSKLQEILKQMKDPELQSFCLVGKVIGDYKERIRIFHEMNHKISSKMDFEIKLSGFTRLINGEIIS